MLTVGILRGITMIPGAFRNQRATMFRWGHQRLRARAFSIQHYFRGYRSTSSEILTHRGHAAAHHRFNYIHPLVDGNGRVSRLMSHAMALQAGIGAQGLWSISRGLARGLGDASQYKRMMDEADSPRRGDLDGRGNLSLQSLIEFVTWFCRVALDIDSRSWRLVRSQNLEGRFDLVQQGSAQ